MLKSYFLQKNLLLFACILCLLFACDEPEIKLSRLERKNLDTLVNHQLDSISPILDSLCDARQETYIQKAVDSIIAERKRKEERLRSNLPKD